MVININNYITELQQSLILYLSSEQYEKNFVVTSQFKKPSSPISLPIVSLSFDKISIIPMAMNNYISESVIDKHQIDINFSFSIYVPVNLGVNTCYDIFYEISNSLLKNEINIPFQSINCDNITFLKPINCFLLTAFAPISIIPI